MAYTTYSSGFSKKRAEADKAAQSVTNLRDRIKSGSLAGVYLFRGEEEYLKRYYYGELKKAAGDSSNITEFYAESFSFSEFYDALTTAPDIDYSGSFFDEPTDSKQKTYRIVRAFDPKLSSLTAKEEERFLSLCKEPLDAVIVVLYFSAAEDEKKFSRGFLKKIAEAANETVFLHESPGSPKLRKWVQKHVSSAGALIDDRTAEYFLTAVGNDMTTLSFELEKLTAYKRTVENKTVTFDEIDRICIRTDEAKIEELSDALFRGDLGKAENALTLLLREKTSETYILGALAGRIAQLCGVQTYRDEGFTPAEIGAKLGLWDSKVRSAIATLSALKVEQNPQILPKLTEIATEYDRKLKGSPCDKGILLSDMMLAMKVAMGK